MIHLGDITKIKGNEAPTVDCIIGGSPCQDLSLAGKRAGLAGARSGLYMEQIRIIKEMREYDRANGRTGVDVRPRYMVWENVPGAFSTNKGEDFAAVLEEAIRVAEPEAPSVPVPEKGWPTAGCIVGECWSVAWRVLDAQFWGTSDKPLPQRRRRIALIADFGGLSAPEILFVRQSVSGNLEPGKPKGKESPRDAGESSCGAGKPVISVDQGGGKSGASSYEDVSPTLTCTHDGAPAVAYTYDARGNGDGQKCATLTGDHQNRVTDYTSVVLEPVTFEPGIAQREGGHIYDGVSGTLRANAGDNQMAVAYSIENHSGDSRVDINESGKVQTLTSRIGTGGGNVPMVMEPVGFDAYNQAVTGDKAKTLSSIACDSDHIPVVIEPKGFEMQAFGKYKDSGIASSLKARDHKDATDLIVNAPIAIDRAFFNQGKNAQYEPQVYDDGTVSTLVSKGPSAVAMRHIVRRLTPLECERLQGFPDGWTDIGEWVDTKGKKHKEADSPRYKALGNSIAIPPWKWVLKRLCACYERDATMASLFDGIGGFPYIWEQLNGKGSCLWASEIEEFPIAVTKLRFGGSENG